MSKQPRCRICKKRPPWKYRNCPPGVCKWCYHKHVWPERPGARAGREPADEGSEPRPMVYDGYCGGFVPVGAALRLRGGGRARRAGTEREPVRTDGEDPSLRSG
jgi:hypothetical protein